MKARSFLAALIAFAAVSAAATNPKVVVRTEAGDIVVINDQPELDFGGRRNPDGRGFAVFGRVIEGMAVVRAIQALPAQGQQLTPPVKIISVRRIETLDTKGERP
jgi:cyclophilin family peptidyl-prolyl cis-trans isomerase